MNDTLAAEILEHIRHLDSKLTAHMDNEGKEIQSIRDDLAEWRISAERRHSELIRSLEAWTAKIDCSDAFLKTPDGKIDIPGHYDDHLTRKEFADEVKELKRNTRKVVVGAGAVSALSGLFYLLWEALLRGPR